MAKKKLKICIKLVLADNVEFENVHEFNPSSASNLLENVRKCLNEIYGIPLNSNKGFENLSINSFQSVDVDVEEIL